MNRLVPLLAGAALAFACSRGGEPVRSWPKQFGTAYPDRATSVATDRAGNVYVGGHWYNGHDVFPPTEGANLFVTKCSTLGGSLLWTRRFGAFHDDRVLSIATDPDGNVYATGNVYPEFPASLRSELFVVKLSAGGVELWARQLGSGVDAVGRSIATDAGGHIYVAGSTSAADGTDVDLLVVKYDASGELLWTRQLGGPAYDAGWSIAVSASGEAYVAGWTDGELDGNASAGGRDGFLVKYGPDGVKLWSRQFGSADDDEAHSVGLDGAGGVYVAGDATWAFGGAADVVLVKFDRDGLPLWTRRSGVAWIDRAHGVASDAAGGVYVAGVTTPTTGGSIETRADALARSLRRPVGAD